MAAKDYSFEPVASAPPAAEAVPATPAQETEADEAESPSDAAIMIGCGILGWMVAGPFLAIITALGGKYAADKCEGPIRDVSKAVGSIASAAGKKAKEEHIMCKVKAAIRSIFSKRECARCGHQTNAST